MKLQASQPTPYTPDQLEELVRSLECADRWNRSNPDMVQRILRCMDRWNETHPFMDGLGPMVGGGPAIAQQRFRYVMSRLPP